MMLTAIRQYYMILLQGDLIHRTRDARKQRLNSFTNHGYPMCRGLYMMNKF